MLAAALSAPPGLAGAYSDTQAHAMLARELQRADALDIQRIQKALQDMMRKGTHARLKTLAKKIEEIAPVAFPDGYVAPGLEALLQQHTINLTHYTMPPALKLTFD